LNKTINEIKIESIKKKDLNLNYIIKQTAGHAWTIEAIYEEDNGGGSLIHFFPLSFETIKSVFALIFLFLLVKK
jgi:hypothetical protein